MALAAALVFSAACSDDDAEGGAEAEAPVEEVTARPDALRCDVVYVPSEGSGHARIAEEVVLEVPAPQDVQPYEDGASVTRDFGAFRFRVGHRYLLGPMPSESSVASVSRVADDVVLDQGSIPIDPSHDQGRTTGLRSAFSEGAELKWTCEADPALDALSNEDPLAVHCGVMYRPNGSSHIGTERFRIQLDRDGDEWLPFTGVYQEYRLELSYGDGPGGRGLSGRVTDASGTPLAAAHYPRSDWRGSVWHSGYAPLSPASLQWGCDERPIDLS